MGNCLSNDTNVKIINMMESIEENRQSNIENTSRIIKLEDKIDSKIMMLNDKIGRIDDKLDCKLDLILTAINRPIKN